MRARNRRPPRDVLIHEIGDDGLLELALEVDDVVGDAQAPGDAACVVQVIEAAAAAVARLSLALIVQLHGQTDDVVARFGQQRGGDG